MASVDFKKIKAVDRYYAFAICRHNDKYLREEKTHSNEDIDKNKTKYNKQKFDYNTTKRRINEKIKEIEKTNTNKRKDRVEFFALCVTPPLDMTDVEMQEKFLKDAFALIIPFCNEVSNNKNNVINFWLHKDEIHEYYDNGVKRESKMHGHILTSCEMNGSLNAKMFSSKERIKEINQKIDVMCREKYNMPFITNNNDVRKKKVEELKLDSLIQENELKTAEIERKNEEINRLQAVYEEFYKKVLNLMKKIKDKERTLKEYEELKNVMDKMEEHKKLELGERPFLR